MSVIDFTSTEPSIIKIGCKPGKYKLSLSHLPFLAEAVYHRSSVAPFLESMFDVTLYWTTFTKHRHKRRHGKRVTRTTKIEERRMLGQELQLYVKETDLPIGKHLEKGCRLTRVDWIDRRTKFTVHYTVP